jgi:hypothetical protein
MTAQDLRVQSGLLQRVPASSERSGRQSDAAQISGSPVGEQRVAPSRHPSVRTGRGMQSAPTSAATVNARATITGREAMFSPDPICPGHSRRR